MAPPNKKRAKVDDICEYRPKKPSENVCRLLFPILVRDGFFPKRIAGRVFSPRGGSKICSVAASCCFAFCQNLQVFERMGGDTFQVVATRRGMQKQIKKFSAAKSAVSARSPEPVTHHFFKNTGVSTESTKIPTPT